MKFPPLSSSALPLLLLFRGWSTTGWWCCCATAQPTYLDYCQNAQPLVLQQEENTTILLAGAVNETADGILYDAKWFQTIGDGRFVGEDYCNKSTPSLLTFVTGPSCEQLSTVTPTVRFNCQDVWHLENDVEYYVVMRSIDYLRQPWAEATLSTVEAAAVAAASDDDDQKCVFDSAVLLPMHSTFFLWLNQAELTTNVPTVCQELLPAATYPSVVLPRPGILVKVMGTGNPLRVNSCPTIDIMGSVSGVFRGTCADPTCVAVGRTGFSGDGSSCVVNWNSEEGVEYYVLIHPSSAMASGVNLLLDEPAPTLPPTNVPTIAPARNDLCRLAETLRIGVSVGADHRGTDDGILDDTPIRCHGKIVTTKGAGRVWHKVLGTGETLRVFDNCASDDDVVVAVFGGSCDELVCDIVTHPFTSEAIWQSEIGVEYLVLVQSSRNYQIEIESIAPPKNDLCETAEPFALGSPITGSTVASTDGIWYKTVGTGGLVHKDPCSGPPYMTFFTGTCDQLVRRDTSFIDGCADAWFLEEGVDYLVLVVDEPERNPTTVSLLPFDVFTNDLCDDAESIAIGSTMSGSVFNATVDDFTRCEIYQTLPIRDNMRGVWYKATGNGKVLGASTCDGGGSNVSQPVPVNVYGGACNAPICVDYATSFACGVTWESQEGVEYHILVQSEALQGFELALYEATTDVANDMCENAEPIAIGSTVTGSLLHARMDVQAGCQDRDPAAGVWFKVVGNGNGLGASTCGGDGFSPTVSVFGGTCADPTCLRSFYSCDTKWPSEVGVEYYILVQSDFSPTFALTLYEFTPAANDLCENAAPITVGSTASVSLVNASIAFDGPVVCANGNPFTPPTGFGVWFTATGNGRLFTADICNDSGFAPRVSVFSGTCADRFCTGDEPVATCSMTWVTEPGADYYILVHSFYLDSVPELALASAPPDNNVCDTAEPITIGSAIIGTVLGVDHEPIACQDDGRDTYPGVWYTVTGNGAVLGINACDKSPAGRFLMPSVFGGTCADPTCIVDASSTGNFVCEAAWQTEDGVDYYIYVQFSWGTNDLYEFSLFEVAPAGAPFVAPPPVVKRTKAPSEAPKPSIVPSWLPSGTPSIAQPAPAPVAAPTKAPVNPPTGGGNSDGGCVTRCVFVNLATREEQELTGDDSYVPSAVAGRYSIRCENNRPVSHMSFGYDGRVHKESTGPYWMSGDSNAGLWVNNVPYLQGCGSKLVTVWANDAADRPQECFRRVFKLESKCGPAAPSSPTKAPIKAPKTPTKAPTKSPSVVAAPVAGSPVVAPPTNVTSSCVQKCVLVNLLSASSRKIEQELKGTGAADDWYIPNAPGEYGYSIRCDASRPVSHISFAYDGIVRREMRAPYWMNGDSNGGLWINDVPYLDKCTLGGAKTVTVWAHDADTSNKQECYRQTFTLGDRCGAGP